MVTGTLVPTIGLSPHPDPSSWGVTLSQTAISSCSLRATPPLGCDAGILGCLHPIPGFLMGILWLRSKGAF